MVMIYRRIRTGEALGAGSYSVAHSRVCGNFDPPEETSWKSLVGEVADPDYRKHAGVYESDLGDYIALNRPLTEDDWQFFAKEQEDLVKRLFPYRSCTKHITGKATRPCLEYYINRCVAPCTGYATKEDYAKVISQVVMFMDGETGTVTRDLKQNMNQASEQLQFERAAVLRDRIKAVEKVAEEQRIKVDSNPVSDMDVIALAQGNNEAWVEVFFIRNGKLIGRDHFFMQGTQDDTEELVLGQFVKQFYQTAALVVPPRIIIQHLPEDSETITEWLRQVRNGAVRLVCPQRGIHKQLIQTVADNARQGLAQHRITWMGDTDVIQQATADLQEELSLPLPLHRMECYDISHIQGSNTVASMVVFEDGKPKTTHYRRFKMKTVDGVDDFASMREVLRRRFNRLASARAIEQRGEEDRPSVDSFGVIPDLVLIDGGKGQLSAALEVLLEMGLDDIPLASLAKENEELFVPHTPEPIILPRDSHALYLVQRIRDEAHRFAITYHRNLRSKNSLKSPIDNVSGIGPKRKRMVMRRFGTLKGIKEAAVDDLASVPGMTRSLAIRLKQTI